MSSSAIIVYALLGMWLFYHNFSRRVWLWTFGIILLVNSVFVPITRSQLIVLWSCYAVVWLFYQWSWFRLQVFTKPIFHQFKKSLPEMSRTEREALQAGTVGWEGEFFKGKVDLLKLLNYSAAELTEEEQAFIDGPVEQLCQMIDDWKITFDTYDLPPELWQFLKKEGFFGLIIPKSFGGKEFSAYAHAAIITKIYSKSVTVSITVAVPNSLGPAELLLHYGTEQQKNYYLPRLSAGEEIPCFALTGPMAGSDASAMPDTGIVEYGEFEGKRTLGLRLNWDKRYITLAPVATVLGLAFKMYDPQKLLGDKFELGITCALIPTNTKGISIGRRHFPLNIPFQNGPTQGKDVFIPLDWIIGGVDMAGHGWRMLMECLAAGRAITLPSGGVAGLRTASMAAGAYGFIRRQFNLPIGYFEGVEEALARIGGNTYLVDAAWRFTLAAIDRGEKPAVASAIMKYHATTKSRQCMNDAMDVHGGKGICLGPLNYLGRLYQSIPIGVTVEGANILTRCLIIFGQGAVRCHPYLYPEMLAAQNNEVKTFDKLFFAHLGSYASYWVRSLWLGLTSGRMLQVPTLATRRYCQMLQRYTASFALISDTSLFMLGANLKRKEKISARLGDILSNLYLVSAVIKKFHDEGIQKEDYALLDWSCQELFYLMQEQFNGILLNFPNRWVAKILKLFIFPLGRNLKQPSDNLGHAVARILLTPSEARDRLTAGIYATPAENNPLGQMNANLPLFVEIDLLEKRLRQAELKGQISGEELIQRTTAAKGLGILSEEEAEKVLMSEQLRLKLIAVDSF